jgi:hypothetical protein
MALTLELAHSLATFTEVSARMHNGLLRPQVDLDLVPIHEFSQIHSASIISLAYKIARRVPTNIVDLTNIFERFLTMTKEQVPVQGWAHYIPMGEVYQLIGITSEVQVAAGSTSTVRVRDGRFELRNESVLGVINTCTNALLKIKCWTVIINRLQLGQIRGDPALGERINKRIPTNLLIMLATSTKAIIRMPLELYMMSSILQGAINVINGQTIKLIARTKHEHVKNTIQNRMFTIRRSLESHYTTSTVPTRIFCHILTDVTNGLLQLINDEKFGSVIMNRTGPQDNIGGRTIKEFMTATDTQRNHMIQMSMHNVRYVGYSDIEHSRGRSMNRSESRMSSSRRRRSTSSGIGEYFIRKLEGLDFNSSVSSERSRVRSQSRAGRGRESSFQTQ